MAPDALREARDAGLIVDEIPNDPNADGPTTDHAPIQLSADVAYSLALIDTPSMATHGSDP